MMSYLDFSAVDTICGLAKALESLGTTANIKLSESAWLWIAVNSGMLAIWAAVRAIWAEDRVSSGLAAEDAVAVAPLRVLALTVWLVERLVMTNRPTSNNKRKLPPI